jgi:hypothetical protein
MTNYNSLLQGARGLLGDCCRVLEDIDLEYAIVGGWSPYLLNSTKFKHPGTYDVDLLFKDGEKEGTLEQVVQKFLNEGFVLSAKHNFQLLKVLKVAATRFVYNVDFLHSSDNNRKEDMFVDHLNLPVPLNGNLSETYKIKSIMSPQSAVIFSEGLHEVQKEVFILPDTGKEATLKFSLINEAGLIITKTSSVKQVKRQRDSFDIYIAIKQARNYQSLVKIFQDIKYKNGDLFNTLYGIREAIKENGMVYNAYKYACPDDNNPSLIVSIKEDLENFLKEVGLEEKAEHDYYKPGK